MEMQLKLDEDQASKERILIVDDEKHIRDLIYQTLTSFGYICDTAANGRECLNKIKKGNNYDVLLLDVQMPKLNGIETMKQLKKVTNSDFSIIMVSASRDIDDVKGALKEGAYDYLFKPFNIYEVESIIKRAVERTNLIKQNKDYQKNLENKVVAQTMELIELYAGTLEAMVLALDLREKETGFHSYRVTEYALTLSRKLGLGNKEISAIAKGALLHDIGKIGVPDEILLKPGKLNDEEWKVMKIHPVLGYEMLQKIEFLEDAAPIVLHHHEYYDGNGYPEKLSGDDIPIGARVFSVVDALDAMTSVRVYKKAISFTEARKNIEAQSGTQFDPKVVDAFLKIPIKEFRSIRSKVEKTGFDYLKGLLHDLSKKS